MVIKSLPFNSNPSFKLSESASASTSPNAWVALAMSVRSMPKSLKDNLKDSNLASAFSINLGKRFFHLLIFFVVSH